MAPMFLETGPVPRSQETVPRFQELLEILKRGPFQETGGAFQEFLKWGPGFLEWAPGFLKWPPDSWNGPPSQEFKIPRTFLGILERVLEILDSWILGFTVLIGHYLQLYWILNVKKSIFLYFSVAVIVHVYIYLHIIIFRRRKGS